MPRGFRGSSFGPRGLYNRYGFYGPGSAYIVPGPLPEIVFDPSLLDGGSDIGCDPMFGIDPLGYSHAFGDDDGSGQQADGSDASQPQDDGSGGSGGVLDAVQQVASGVADVIAPTNGKGATPPPPPTGGAMVMPQDTIYAQPPPQYAPPPPPPAYVPPPHHRHHHHHRHFVPPPLPPPPPPPPPIPPYGNVWANLAAWERAHQPQHPIPYWERPEYRERYARPYPYEHYGRRW